eukprot:TRINITY_DN13416_c0_g1_i4.p2 TRINITY_DN13416_c0_g1~~TRINITY_DN13416_c0_g1_i4.p2  ORF type:complete len:197 (-),score=68.54 TRINITY_DN13416_c0_g1_i4:656-1246(-)
MRGRLRRVVREVEGRAATASQDMQQAEVALQDLRQKKHTTLEATEAAERRRGELKMLHEGEEPFWMTEAAEMRQRVAQLSEVLAAETSRRQAEERQQEKSEKQRREEAEEEMAASLRSEELQRARAQLAEVELRSLRAQQSLSSALVQLQVQQEGQGLPADGFQDLQSFASTSSLRPMPRRPGSRTASVRSLDERI